MGRPSKGDRDAMMIRPAALLGRAVRAHAAAEGLSINEYITGVLATRLGMPELAPAPRHEEELPMTG
jgi:predicted HicB family RNase H-like nuclease